MMARLLADLHSQAFLHAAHAMSGAAELEKHEQRQLMVRLITSLRDQTQSKAEHDDCNKMLAVLS